MWTSWTAEGWRDTTLKWGLSIVGVHAPEPGRSQSQGEAVPAVVQGEQQPLSPPALVGQGPPGCSPWFSRTRLVHLGRWASSTLQPAGGAVGFFPQRSAEAAPVALIPPGRCSLTAHKPLLRSPLCLGPFVVHSGAMCKSPSPMSPGWPWEPCAEQLCRRSLTHLRLRTSLIALGAPMCKYLC